MENSKRSGLKLSFSDMHLSTMQFGYKGAFRFFDLLRDLCLNDVCYSPVDMEDRIMILMLLACLLLANLDLKSNKVDFHNMYCQSRFLKYGVVKIHFHFKTFLGI